jgi:hypothetical protein
MPRTIFVSHKRKDRVAAEKIRSALSLYGGTNLEVFVSERIEAGVDWNKQILGNLQKADWLLLLYTDPSEEWDWCLFEAGFFAGCAKNGQCRLTCLHTVEVPPPMPLQRWQSVPVTDGTMMENFLKDLYSGINTELINSPTMLRNLADTIAGAFSVEVRRKIETHWHTEYVTISMNKAQIEELQKTVKVPAGALCGTKEGESINIFGVGSGQCTMENLELGLHPHYKEMWLKSLAETLRTVTLKKWPVPRIPVLYSPSSQKDYHVTLHCVDHFSDGSLEFYLLFVEKTPEAQEEQGRQLQSLGNMLRLGRAFRWKILTKFHRELSVLKQRKSSQNEIEGCFERLNWSINWVIGESQRLDILTPDDVLDIFEDGEVKKELRKTLENVWPDLIRIMREGIANTDIDKVLNALTEMLRANKQYMIHAAGRYKELLKEMP